MRKIYLIELAGSLKADYDGDERWKEVKPW